MDQKLRILILGPIQIPVLANKLNFTIDTTVKGLGGVPVVNQILSLLSFIPNLEVITLTNEVTPQEKIEIVTDTLKIHIAYLHPGHGAKKLCYSEVKNIRSFFKNIEYDLIISNFTVEYSLATLLQKKPYFIVIHDHPWRILKTQKYHPYWIIRFLISIYIYWKGKNFIAVNNYVGNYLKKITRKPVQILGNPLREEVFGLFVSDRIKQLDNQRLRIISVISWGELKNVKNALLAFNIFTTAYPDSEYILIGSGLGYGEKGHHWAVENHIEKNVQFLGVLSNEQVYEQLNLSHILLHPSREEAASMIISEAMAIGLAIVAGDKSGGVPEQLEYGKLGVLTDINVPESIATSLTYILDNSQKVSEQINHAFQNALTNNHPKAWGEKFLNIAVELFTK